ncbi:hypothetical protein [Vibrio cholerae]|uniref:hypothetical protein n=1 Tax=Vibrio cholerae TaxID=666 RepID=UPI002EC56C37|nr:hypothetical protein [Vibrio cholerae]EGR1037826.1 hypothetical protein [Vibrio cholerae]MEE3775658.1 hypothetical protein [Vibrio cholerae]
MTNFIFNTDKINKLEPKGDNATEQELVDDVQEIEITELQAKVSHLEAITEVLKRNQELKENITFNIENYLRNFSIFVGITFWFYLSSFLYNGKEIPESVMIAFITTTFGTVLGLMVIILKGLFGTK